MIAKNKLTRIKYIVLALIALSSIAGLVYVKQMRLSPLTWDWFGPVSAADGVALEGYDTVAYHTDNKAVNGRSEYRLAWKEVEWRFASEFNLEKFKSNPEKYAPQFGGNCANAVSKGLTKKADPQTWLIKDDKLYVFNTETAKQEFLAKIPQGIIEQSHANWTKRMIQ